MRNPSVSRPTALLAATTLLVALSACTPDSPPPTPSPSSSAPAITLNLPDGFASTAATWGPLSTLSALDPDGNRTKSTAVISPDGATLGHVQRDGDTYTVREVVLSTGEVIEHADVRADLDPIDGTPPVAVRYTGGKLAVVTMGTNESGARTWRAALFHQGKPGDGQTVEGDLPDGGAPLVLRTPSGVLIGTGKSSGDGAGTVVVAADGQHAMIPAHESGGTGCAVASCTIPLTPEAEVGGQPITSYSESLPQGAISCGDGNEDAPNKGCVKAFRGEGWTSLDANVAPEGADPRTGRIYAVSDSIVVGQWLSSDGKSSVFRMIDPRDPTATHGTWACQGDVAPGESPARLVSSPSGDFLVAGRVLVDKKTTVAEEAGACLAEQDGLLTAVDDKGTAYGFADDSGTHMKPGSVFTYTSGADPRQTKVGSDVLVPQQFIAGDKGSVAVFLDSDHAMAGVLVAGAYPSS